LLEREPAKTSLPSSELAIDSILPVVKGHDDPSEVFDRVGLTSTILTTGASSDAVSDAQATFLTASSIAS
jgi:hypothetical protein